MENDEQRSFDRDSEREEQHQEYARIEEINLPPKGWATRIMEKIIWGKAITPENIDLSPNDEVWTYKPSEDDDNEPF